MRASERDYFADRLTRPELEALAQIAGGIRKVFAFGSPSFKKLGRAPESYADAELVDLVVGEPRFLRRPLLVADDGRVLVGAKAVASG